MSTTPPPSTWKIFTTWLILGIQSFGGGTSTFFLIHQVCIRNGWVSEDEFIRTWALAQIAPGINLVKLTIMLGHKMRGWPGLLAGVAGLLLPSAAITVLMTAGFGLVRNQPIVQAAMRGILPATIGLGLTMAYQMAQPVLFKAHKEGPNRLSLHVLILAVATLLMAFNALSPVLILVAAGGVTTLLLAVVPVRERPVVKEGGQ